MGDMYLDFTSPDQRLAYAAAKRAERFKAELLTQGAAQVLASQLARAASESAALAAQAAASGRLFKTEADAGLLALANGSLAFVNTVDGDFYSVEMVSGAPVRRTTFLTKFSNRHVGVNLWEYAKGDTKEVTGAAMTSGSANLATGFDLFTARDVGKVIMVKGAGPSGKPFSTTIATYTDARHIVLAAPAGTTVSGALIQFGTDDTAGIRAAIAAAVAAGGVQINCGGPDLTYLIAAAEETFGTYTHPTLGAVPFKRGIIRMYSNLHFLGSGAKLLLSGGRSDPGGIFYTPFWEGTGEYTDNFSMEGIDLDGNLPNQFITPYPASTPDHQIWQHGHGMVTYGVRNWRVENCTIHGFRGAGIQLGSLGESGSSTSSRGVKVLNCTFYDNFSYDVGSIVDNTEIAYCLFKDGVCDSRWVHAVSIEKLDPAYQVNNIDIHHNTFDFRYGLQPPEAWPQYASDSAEALAARKHYRRACSFSFFYGGFPGNQYNGTMAGVRFTDNTIYQGSVDVFNYIGVDISRNRFVNTYENFGFDVLHAITVSQSANASPPYYVVGLTGVTIHDNLIDHDMSSYGILVDTYTNINVRGGYVKHARAGGVRINGCSGSVSDIDIVDVGRNDDALDAPLRGSYSSGVVCFGGGAHPLVIDNIRASETRGGGAIMKYGVYANWSARPIMRVKDTTAQDMLLGAVRDVNNTTLQHGNVNVISDNLDPVLLSIPNLQTTNFNNIGSFSLRNAAGNLVLSAGESFGSDAVNVSFFNPGSGLEAQLQYLYTNGSFRMGTFHAGVLDGFPVTVKNDGTAEIIGTVTAP